MSEESVSKHKELLDATISFSETISSLSPEFLFEVYKDEGFQSKVSGVVQSAFIHILSLYKNSQSFDFSQEEILNDFSLKNSYLPFPVGYRSPDDSAILGRDGTVFLIGGSNNVIGQYSPDCDDAEQIGPRWLDMIVQRKRQLADLGAKYIHIFIPEKISTLPDLFPSEISTPTRLITFIENNILETDAASSVMSGFKILIEHPNRNLCYSKLDSHLSPTGTFEIFRAILREKFRFEVPDYEFSFGRKKLGDMAHRMTGYYTPETSYEIDTSILPEFTKHAVLQKELIPEQGLKGITQVWRNESAPIDARVVVFGNSYFSFERNGQSGLSWWFARYFKEFHFIWTNEVEFDYVESTRPDVVLWQGVERFATVLPAS